MNSVGIIAEYNPFHNGHEYHIRLAKELSGAANIVVAMSANFVQRGEPACMDKFTRARLALLGGADVVIEIPDLLSCSCAERFAYAGVRLLASTGMVSTLAFGSECGDIEQLKNAASIDPNSADIKRSLSVGLSYPRAFAEALKNSLVSFDASAPNDTLAIEYIRQLRSIACDISPVAVRRAGAGYNDATLETEFASASALRDAATDIKTGRAALIRHIPTAILAELTNKFDEGHFPATMDMLSPAIMYALRSMSAREIAKLADVSEGLENLLYRAALSSDNCAELLDNVKTKRYTLARLKRILIYALIGTTAELQRLAFKADDALYIRLLGIRKEKLHLLSVLSKKATLPIVIQASDINGIPENAKKVLEHSRRASLIHSLAFPKNRACKDDFSNALIVV